MFVLSAMVTRSMGTTGGDSSAISSVCVTVNSVPMMMAPCSASEPAHPAGERRSPASVAAEMLFLVAVVFTGRLCDIRDQSDMGKSRRADECHHLHDAPVIDRFVAANEYSLVIAVGGNRGEPRHQIIF